MSSVRFCHLLKLNPAESLPHYPCLQSLLSIYEDCGFPFLLCGIRLIFLYLAQEPAMDQTISSKRRKPRSIHVPPLPLWAHIPQSFSSLQTHLSWIRFSFPLLLIWVPWYCPQLPVLRGILHGYLFLKKENNFSVQWYSDRGKKRRYSQPLPLHPVIKGEFICYQILDHRIYLLSDRSCTGRAMDNDWLNCSQII